MVDLYRKGIGNEASACEATDCLHELAGANHQICTSCPDSSGNIWRAYHEKIGCQDSGFFQNLFGGGWEDKEGLLDVTL